MIAGSSSLTDISLLRNRLCLSTYIVYMYMYTNMYIGRCTCTGNVHEQLNMYKNMYMYMYMLYMDMNMSTYPVHVQVCI